MKTVASEIAAPGSCRFRRAWSLACGDTMQVRPIGEWVRLYLGRSECSIDPFARNCRFAQWTNDLNPDTAAECHMDAFNWRRWLSAQGVRPDLCIFDPPYSRNQVKRTYQAIGRYYGIKDSQEHTSNWTAERDALDAIMRPAGVVLSFGWNSNGMTRARGYDLEDILMVAHGGASNDTICIAERKRPGDPEFWQDPM